MLAARGTTGEPAPSPLRDALFNHRGKVVAGFGITIVWTVCTYFFLIYMPTYVVRQLGLAQGDALLSNSISLTVLVILAPLFGALSDRIGRMPLLLCCSCLIMLSAYPLLYLLTANASTGMFVGVQIIFAVLIAGFTGPAPATMAELYPPEMRSTGLSLSYNFAVTIFGRFAPFISTWLIA